MKVSIVIPVYNAERYLKECIESALNQTYKDIEVIAVDDGSTDGSPEILNGYSDKIKIITKKNGGTASALNAGINRMQGEWFKWLSADDVLLPTAIEDLISTANELGKKDAHRCIFYANHEIIDSNSKKIDSFFEPNLGGLNDFERNIILLDHFIGNAISGFFHKSIFEKCGLFDEEIGFSEDYEFWLRCCILHGYRLYSIPKFTARGRVHSQQLTRTKKTAVAQLELIRKMVLDKLDQESKKRYLQALKSWRKKQYSRRVRLRRISREILFRIMPYKFAKTFYQIYSKIRNL